MKTVELTVRFNAQVPDDVDPDKLYIGVDTANIRIFTADKGVNIPRLIADAKVNEYETVFGEEVK